ncbi:diaminopimelate epimerase [Rhodococcus sp. EPR-157]|uniref:diaminopimelate epimerase n=1 Tax=Rhodococcus sp. EPR-157 TaxID=1813677 RepID=UPI0007BB3E52|nr:diaminopimelate epimerase [Rhodococcus sp. EPR-157]KZF05506.1 diaminopimelate epimerase [Rhodococcus sp. EPR-157]
MHFVKGHGTQNDFVVLHDPDVKIELLRPRVAALCDRRRGLGADGVLRVARAGALRDAGVLDRLPTDVGAEDWFMDYRNGDGSIAEMCGNGVRVFAHYLRVAGLETEDRFVVGSRAGARPVIVHKFDDTTADVTVSMGDVHLMGASSTTLAGRRLEGIGIDVGNPHLACVDPSVDIASLRALDLSVAPELDSDFFTAGANVEILTRLQFGRVDMRVFERGVGETRSCGTGTVAAAAAALSYEGQDSGQVVVGVPGGEVTVSIDDSGATLRGPSVLVATGTIGDDWWRELA